MNWNIIIWLVVIGVVVNVLTNRWEGNHGG